MKVHFKQAAHIGGKNYLVGLHEVPDEHTQHPFFQKLIKAGLVIDGDEAPVKPFTEKERQERLAEKVFKSSQLAVPAMPPQSPQSAPQAAPAQPVEAPAESAQAPSEPEAGPIVEDEVDKADKPKKKHKR